MEAGERQQANPSLLESLDSDGRSLYEVIPLDGSAISNKAARQALGWETEDTTERYFSVRDRLEDAGLIVRGRGRGGTVRRTAEEAPTEGGEGDGDAEAVEEVADALANSIRREHDLTRPCSKSLSQDGRGTAVLLRSP